MARNDSAERRSAEYSNDRRTASATASPTGRLADRVGDEWLLGAVHFEPRFDYSRATDLADTPNRLATLPRRGQCSRTSVCHRSRPAPGPEAPFADGVGAVAMRSACCADRRMRERLLQFDANGSASADVASVVFASKNCKRVHRSASHRRTSRSDRPALQSEQLRRSSRLRRLPVRSRSPRSRGHASRYRFAAAAAALTVSVEPGPGPFDQSVASAAYITP